MDEETKSAFRTEFKALLEKYKVHIDFSVGPCSDTHGLYDERVAVSYTIPNSYKTEEIISVDGWCISADDL